MNRVSASLLAVLISGCGWLTPTQPDLDIDQTVIIDKGGHDITSGALNFRCERSSCNAGGCSSITCRWDGEPGQLCAEADGVAKVCAARSSGQEFDPEVNGVARAWSVTLEDGGSVIAGPVTVETDS